MWMYNQCRVSASLLADEDLGEKLIRNEIPKNKDLKAAVENPWMSSHEPLVTPRGQL